MAKKQARKVDVSKTTKPRPAVRTLDERDAAASTAVERSADSTAETTRDYQEERFSGNARDFDESSPIADDERPDVDKLPINHQTLMDERNKGGLPPEATPREGKTSPAPPIVYPGQEESDRRSRRQERVLVEAIAAGYYDLIRRRPGDVFYIRSKEDFSKKWMRPAAPGAQPSVSTPNQAIRQAHDAILAGRSDRRSVTGGLDQATEENPLDAD